MEKQTKIAKKIFRQIRNKKAQALLYVKIYLKLQQLKEYKIGTGANVLTEQKSPEINLHSHIRKRNVITAKVAIACWGEEGRELVNQRYWDD